MGLIRFPLVFLFCLLPSLAFAGTTYYVDATNGADNNSGKSMNLAWKTISRVNKHSFATGDDVYFKCGETWSGTQLKIDWNGSAADQAIIGAYYNDGGNPVYGVSGSRPIIDGNNWTVPTSEGGLIKCQDNIGGHITIKDLYVRHSKYYGIIIKNCGTNNLVENCYVYRTKKHGIILGKVDYSTVTKCTVQESSYLSKPMGGIVVVAYGYEGFADYNTVSYNTVFNTYEGINTTQKARWTTIQYNVVYDCRSFHIYTESSKYTTIRFNLLYGSSKDGSWDGPDRGIVIGNEETRIFCYTGGHKVYGNLIANTQNGITINSQYANHCVADDPNQPSTYPDCECAQTDNLIYNNTIVDSTQYNIRVEHDDKPKSGTWSGNEIKNNISRITSGSNHITGVNAAGFTWSNNLFDKNPGGNAGTNAVIGDPKLLKTSGWRSIPPGTAIGTEWSIQPGSAAQGKGMEINGYMERIYDCNFAAGPDPITVKKRIAVTPDIGAWMTTVLAKPGSISAPKSFMVKVD